ncbi:MAG TPA: SAM-dependent chlorinase/fluorinase, partial [Syntrophorhabdaceae bacterium]|nr:SAM-dependent chlorinase/fluorinase [Syntrophorhabdaceae bacterium]
MNQEKIITFLTDFGTKDSYVGQMKGVVLSINPRAKIIDITHEIEPQDIREAAFVLKEYYPYFPEGTIHVAVVDPEVG